MRGDKLLRFGEQIAIKVIASAAEKQGNDGEICQSPGYLARYVTKSVADFGIGVRRFSPGAIDQLDAVAPAGHIVLSWVMLAGSG
jgi:hypothetical protein